MSDGMTPYQDHMDDITDEELFRFYAFLEELTNEVIGEIERRGAWSKFVGVQ